MPPWGCGARQADHIGVTAKDGIVTLTGHVNTFWQKHAAEKPAGRVQGVKALAEEIEIRLPLHFKRADDEIAAAALSRLSWESSIPNGCGQGQGRRRVCDADRPSRLVLSEGYGRQHDPDTQCVTGVSNQLSIKVRPNTATISNDITHALHRWWFFDENDIKVSAEGGKVRLTGTVESWSDRQKTASTAWAAPGTTSVENDLRVS